jgi:general secretion pathway protein M
MRSWWQRLNERERWIVGGGAVLAILLLLYTLIWHPFQTRLKGLRQAIDEQRSELVWMQQAAKEIKRLESTGSAAKALQPGNGPSLLTLVDQTAKSAGLGTSVKRVEPQGDDKLRVQLEQVSFDQMILWLGSLKQEHGVVAVNVIVDRQTESGQVNARLLLQGMTS